VAGHVQAADRVGNEPVPLTVAQSHGAQQEPAFKVAEDLRGVRKGSRAWPLFMLLAAVFIFIAYAIQTPRYEIRLMTVHSLSDIPTSGSNLMVIARGGPGGWQFRLFDRRGEISGHRSEAEAAANPISARALEELRKTISDANWDKEVPASLRPELLPLTAMVILPKYWYIHFPASVVQNQASVYADDLSANYPAILRGQLQTIWIAALYALVPGVAGMVYRRAFVAWFGTALVMLLAINWAADAIDFGSVAPVHLRSTETAFHLVEEAIVLLLIGFRLRRQSVLGAERPDRLRAIGLAIALLLLAGFELYWLYPTIFRRHSLEAAGLLMFVSFVLVTQTRPKARTDHAKNIVVCLDGTWNQPGQTDFAREAVTNVFKLFRLCKGSASSESYHASQFKVYADPQTGIKQVALYYQGVGNKLDNSELGQVLGGGFGLGASAIVERAYLDVVKAYRPGDRIFVFGFSRGAAIARLVAGVIGRRGVPMSLWTLRVFGRHWLLWKSRKALDVKIEVLGCWDTVGSFGISKNVMGIPFQRVNLLKDLSVSLSVKRAYHMVALDETRDSFEPTLMDLDPTAPDRITEVWFSGNHSNVGGGYATDHLSDVTLDFLLKRISSGYASDQGQVPGDESWGLYLSARRADAAIAGGDGVASINPDPRGTIRHSTGPVYSHAPRKLPAHAVIYDSVFDRMYDSLPVYAPQSLFDLNQELVKKRTSIEAEVGHMVATASLDAEGSARILDWNARHLSLSKWSTYAQSVAAIPREPRSSIPSELQNPPRS
jgi:hypothetical protein